MGFIVKNIYEVKKSTAEVSQVQGLYIFTDSTPVSEYEYLGTVNASIGMSGQYTDVKNSLIKKTKKEYADADGIIIYLVTGSTDKADVIKFK